MPLAPNPINRLLRHLLPFEARSEARELRCNWPAWSPGTEVTAMCYDVDPNFLDCERLSDSTRELLGTLSIVASVSSGSHPISNEAIASKIAAEEVAEAERHPLWMPR